MKVDKEAILKQKFWILLGTFAVLWILSLSVLWATAGSPIDQAKSNFDKAKTDVEKYPRPKNDNFLPPWVEDGELFKAHKNKVWGIAWNGDEGTPEDGQPPWRGQKDMYTWPSDRPGGEHDLNAKILYPNSPFSTADREWFKGNKENPVYLKQFDNLYLELKTPPSDKPDPKAPPTGRPLDAVAFKDNQYYSTMKPIDFVAGGKAPDPEECWLVQEDFWVKRELLYVIRDALAMAAHMDPVQPADVGFQEPQEIKALPRQAFKNDTWAVELVFDKTDEGHTRVSPLSRIKNVHVSHRDQNLGTAATPNGVYFRIRQGNGPGWLIAFSGESVPWDQEATLGAVGNKNGFEVGLSNPDKAVQLEQVFDVSDTPITQIDEIEIPKVSHRNANRTLIPTKPDRYGKKDTPAATGTTGTTGTGSPPPGGSMGSPGGMMGSPGGTTMSNPNGGPGGTMSGPPGMAMPGERGGQAGSQSGNVTGTYKIDRNRYVFVTDQSRHLPLAVTLTMDQSHLHEILTAFANSRLRFQTTQVELRRVPSAAPSSTQYRGSTYAGGNVEPSSPGPTERGPLKGFRPTTGGSPPGPGGSTPPGAFNPNGGTPMGMPNPTGGSAGAPPEQENPNLVEVTIYGIASLYERPPQ